MPRRSANWHLYWVESDSIEDCFVVAKNSRSARSVEYHMNGFKFDEVQAVKVMPVSITVERAYKRRNKDVSWPGYVGGKKFFEDLGAQFRKHGKQEEMLLESVVYVVDDYEPGGIYRSRTIGTKAVKEIERDIPNPDYDDEDIWSGAVMHLIAGLGICLVRCQQIEYYIYNSFLLGASRQQKKKYRTLDELKEGWRKKTLGNMLKSIEQAWEIHPLVKASFELFLENRNILVHGLATSDRFDLRTVWGQHELVAFLKFFDIHSRLVKRAFRASYYASIDFGLRQWGAPPNSPKNIFKKKQKEEIGLFFAYFSPKPDSF